MANWTPLEALPLPEMVWPRVSWRRQVASLVARAGRLVWGGLKRWS